MTSHSVITMPLSLGFFGGFFKLLNEERMDTWFIIAFFKRNILSECFILSTLQERRSLVVTSSVVLVLTSEKSFPVLIFSETKHQVFKFWLRSRFACCHPGSIMIHLLRSTDNEGYN